MKYVIGVHEARARIEKWWKPRPRVVEKNVWGVVGMIAARDVVSKVDLPPFDRAAYDGYALRAKDTFGADEGNPVLLRLAGRVNAGEWPEVTVGRGECVEIGTGAPIPKGADAVVMSEYASEEGGRVRVTRAVPPGENVLFRGSELKKGAVIRCAGKILTPRLVGTLAAIGVGKVRVYAKPRVGVIASGDELANPGERLRPGEVYNVNGPMLCAAVSSCGCEPQWLGVAPDEPKGTLELLKKGISSCDAVLVSGGSSAGGRDLVPGVVGKLGKPGLIFHGLAMKPGKPAFVAVVKGKPIFGLPGYPLSALMVFYQVVSPYLRAMSGASASPSISVRASLSTSLRSARGREELVPVKLVLRDGELVAEPVRMGSSAITSLVVSDGYIRIPIEREMVREGEEVEVTTFGGEELV